MINFHGAAKPLSADDFAACLARMPGVEEAALRAVIAVETGGSGFKGGRPDALFEPHLFWAELGPAPSDSSDVAGQKLAKRDDAVAKGLAYQHWIPGHYPNSSAGVYAQIIAACAIDENAALRATSWGLGQILGRECLEAGYGSAAAMVEAFTQSEAAQLMGMVRLTKARHLDQALISHDWIKFALAYNGAGERRNQYDAKLKAAYERIKAGGAVPAGPDEAIRAVQGLLKTLGLYGGATDGIDGPITEEAVKAFQRQQDLTVDGIAGPATRQALAKAVSETATPIPRPPPKVPPLKPKPVTPPPPHGVAIPAGAAAGAGLGGLTGNVWWALAAFIVVVASVYLFSHLKRKA